MSLFLFVVIIVVFNRRNLNLKVGLNWVNYCSCLFVCCCHHSDVFVVASDVFVDVAVVDPRNLPLKSVKNLVIEGFNIVDFVIIVFIIVVVVFGVDQDT